MELEELLGQDYKEGMTDTEIVSALKTKKIVDLSTGKYVNKEMASAKENQLNEQLKDLQAQLDSKLTDDEKKQKDLADKDKIIAKLTETIKQSAIATNKAKIIASSADTLEKLEIKQEDKDFNEFVDLIANEDGDKSSKISSYFGNLLKLAYQKGQENKTKEQMANASTFSTTNGDSTESMNIGERIAKQNAEKAKQQTHKFFK